MSSVRCHVHPRLPLALDCPSQSMKRVSLWVIFATLIDEGGGLPWNAESGLHRIIGFCGLSTHTVSYTTTHHITPPFRAFKTKVT